MKIKQKRQVNLPQLIEWCWENDIDGIFASSNDEKVVVNIQGTKVASFCGSLLPSKKNLFEIEEEIEINEDRKLKAMLYINDYSDVYIKKNWSINDRLQSIEHRDSGTQFIYFMNEDGSIGELIWKDGEMVE